ncbi:MAG: hypothetical protein AAB519_03870 [Patescibacteria group bacterium]
MHNIANYETAKSNADAYYKKIGRIRCPALNNEYVHFTSEGFHHLQFSSGNERSKDEQMTKFDLLIRARKIIEIATTHQEYDECLEMVRKKMKKRREEVAMRVQYWALVAILQGRKVKVIVRQVGTGQKHFYSVIPFWNINHFQGNKIVSTANGNLKNE